MRKLIIALSATTLLTVTAAPAATAGPLLPKIPTNCHELNELLHIDNVKSCDD